MTKVTQIYKCDVCGNIVEVLHAGDGELHCCGKPMRLLKEGSTDGAQEKHVPVIEKTANGYLVKVGSAPHPMEQKHSIEWIELVTDDGTVYRKFLKPDEKPEAAFDGIKADKVTAREYCNLHGLWKAEN